MWKRYAIVAMAVAGYVAITTAVIAASAGDCGAGFAYAALGRI
jgi:hypothetical protein